MALRLCLLLLSLSLASASPTDDPVFRQHLDRVRAFKCSLPRPTSVTVTSLQVGVDVAALSFYPASTVLHRCEGAGCCSSAGQSCRVAESQQVNLTFYVTHVVQRRPPSLLSVRAVNHTRCACATDDRPRR